MTAFKRGLFFLFFLSFFLTNKNTLPYALAEDNCVKSDLGCIPTDVGSFVETYYKWGLGLVGGLSLLFIIIGGYLIMTSRGNPQQLSNGKSYIMYALIGLFLAVFGFLFIEVITQDILKIPGFG